MVFYQETKFNMLLKQSQVFLVIIFYFLIKFYKKIQKRNIKDVELELNASEVAKECIRDLDQNDDGKITKGMCVF